MATNTSVNSPLSGTTGTGNFVGATSPALTTPKIDQINDINGNASLKFYPYPSAVNYLQIDNDAAGGDGPLISCVGSSATMNLRLAPKNGAVQIQTTNAGGTALRIDTGSPTYQHVTFLQFPLTSAVRTVAFPDATGTVALSGSSQNVSFGTVQTSQINDTNGNASLAISATASAVNYLTIQNTSTGTSPNIIATGSDTNLQLGFQAKGNGGFKFACAAPTTVFQIYAGTGTQHLSQINFPDTAGTTTFTFPDATGTVALSGASQNVQFGQVGANGPNISTYALTAHGGTNQNLAISGATLIANAVTLAAVNDANSANVPLEIRASGIYASTGMVDSTAGNMVKWNPTGGQFTYDSLSYDVRAWVNFDGAGTVAIRSSGNVTSITDNGVGDYTINFTNALADANYAMVSSGQNTTAGGASSAVATNTTTTPTSSACRVISAVGTGGNYDATYIGLAFIR